MGSISAETPMKTASTSMFELKISPNPYVDRFYFHVWAENPLKCLSRKDSDTLFMSYWAQNTNWRQSIHPMMAFLNESI
ncbi:hypothetical protein [Neobacillus soli]|uniref:hypothetical protein n=1 Tax=Neobacillus soli TaxID=220688 RepID=UPI000825CD2D|nr:hypothetical protein [Neobacillus soli]